MLGMEFNYNNEWLIKFINELEKLVRYKKCFLNKVCEIRIKE